MAALGAGNPTNRLLVGNLGWETGTPELLAAFKPHGAKDACVMTDRESGRPKGMGFVNFHDDSTAQAALEAMSGSLIAGRHIRISFAALSKRDEYKKAQVDRAVAFREALAKGAVPVPVAAPDPYYGYASGGGDFPPQACVAHAPMAHHPLPLHVFPGSSAVAAFPGAMLAPAPGYGGAHFYQHQQLPPHHFHYQQHLQQHQQLQHHAAYAAQHSLSGYPALPGLLSQPQPGYTASPQPTPWGVPPGFGGRAAASQVDAASHSAAEHPVSAVASQLSFHPYHADPTPSMGVHPFMRHTSGPSAAVTPRPVLAQATPRLIAQLGAVSLPPATLSSPQLSAGGRPQPSGLIVAVGETVPHSDHETDAGPVSYVPLSGLKRGRSADERSPLLSDSLQQSSSISGAAQLVPVTEVGQMQAASQDAICAPGDVATVERSIAVSVVQGFVAGVDGSGDSCAA